LILWLCGVGTVLRWSSACAQAGEQYRSRQGVNSVGPLADVPVSTYDLGLIKFKGLTYHYDFTVLNVGNEVLEIKEVMVG
jgi:hypothetical protein